jgi:hypothetical protein
MVNLVIIATSALRFNGFVLDPIVNFLFYCDLIILLNNYSLCCYDSKEVTSFNEYL